MSEDMTAGMYDVELAIDLDQIPDIAETIPEGRYNAEIASAVPGKSKAGQPKIEVKWKIIEAAFDTGTVHVENRTVLDSISFHPNKMGITKQQLKALGITGQLNMSLGDLASQLLGIRTGIVVGIEKGVNKDADGNVYPDRNRIKRITSKLFVPGGNVDGLLQED